LPTESLFFRSIAFFVQNILWMKVRIALHFFGLGEHTQCMRAFGGGWGVHALLNEIVDRPRLTELDATPQNAIRVESLPIPAADRSEPLALSFAQQRLWFLAQLKGASEACHLSLDVRLSGPLDRRALRQTLDGLVARHEVLRATFHLANDQPVQRFASADIGFALAEHDLRGHAKGETELRRLVEAEASTPFDLEYGPLIRGRLVLLAEHEHALLITMHRIVSDDWSIGVVIEELSELYESFRHGIVNPLPALPIQYADYAARQRRWLHEGILQRQAEYWKAALSGAPVLLELRTDRPRPPQQNFAGARIAIELDAELTKRLKAFSQRNGVTLFMTLLTAWAVLLTRLSDQDEVVIGTPTVNRTGAEIEPLIGVFVNTLALRIDVSGSPTANELLTRVKAQVLSAQAHQDIPFEQVLEVIKPPGNTASHPLFQVMFAWQNTPQSNFDLPGLRVSPIAVPHVTAMFDLMLSLAEDGPKIVGGLEYATALFDGKTIGGYVTCWRNLLEALCTSEAAEIAIGQLQLVTAKERAALIRSGQGERVALPENAMLPMLFAQQAVRTAEATAVISQNGMLSYAELEAHANQLAHYLRQLGVGPDTVVGLCVERSPEMMIGLIGILKAGGAYLPLDPSLPQQRLAFMLRDAGAALLLTQEALTERLPALGTNSPIIRLDADWAEVANCPSHAPVLTLDADHAAYVIYTSGSTGTPKGVVVTHGGLCNYISWAKTVYRSAGGSGVPLLTPLAFDATVTSLFLPLLSGKPVILLPEDRQLEILPESKPSANDYSLLKLTPAHIDILNLLGPIGRYRGMAHCLVVGGEALRAPTIGRWIRQLPEVRIVNEYGPTETVVGCIVHEVTLNDLASDAIPIGRPIWNTRVYVLDDGLEPLPAGVPGELYIAGAGLARGYIGRAGLTSERFVADPYDDAGGRMYRTGDLARWRSDGVLEFLGRADEQVKLHGFRIEPGEIEAVLLQQRGISQAAVIVRSDASSIVGTANNRLLGYIVAAPGAAIDTTELRSELQRRLPDYMVPSAIVVLDRLPLTPNGKLDRRALPAPELLPTHDQPHDDRHTPRTQPDLPLTAAEAKLLTIWRNVLNIPTLSADDDFFAVGGNSLEAVRVIALAERELGMIIPLRTWIEGRTVRRITTLLEHPELPLLPEGIVRIRRGDKGSPIYCLPGAVGGALQFERFANKLPTDRTIYAVEPHNFNVKLATLGSLVDTAAAALRYIREVQPKGPYSIIGFSYGGNLAVEITRMLLQDGERVALLAVLDTRAPGARRKLRGIRKLPRLLQVLRHMRFDEACGYLTSRTLRQLGLITPKPIRPRAHRRQSV
jgi:amino acid adenylation domain-containing protein